MNNKLNKIPDDYEVTFSCDGKIDWESNMTVSANSIDCLKKFTVSLSRQLSDDAVYIKNI